MRSASEDCGKHVKQKEGRVMYTSLFLIPEYPARSFCGERKQSDLSRALDCSRNHSLVRSAVSSCASRKNLPPVGNVLAQLAGVLIIYGVYLVYAERADSSSYSFKFARFARWHDFKPS